MCIHLSRETLKSFLLREAKEEVGIESAHDSILGHWAQIAKKAQTWLNDENTAMLPLMIDKCLI